MCDLQAPNRKSVCVGRGLRVCAGTSVSPGASAGASAGELSFRGTVVRSVTGIKQKETSMLSLRKTSREQGRKGSKFKLFGDCLVLKVIFWEERIDAVGERGQNNLLPDTHQPRRGRSVLGGGVSQTEAMIPHVSFTVLHLSCSLWVGFDGPRGHYCTPKTTASYKYWMSSASHCELFSPF